MCGAVAAAVGVALLLAFPPTDPEVVTLPEILVVLPLCLALPVAVLIAVWAIGRAEVAPVGLTRGRRIVGVWAVVFLLVSAVTSAASAVGAGPVWAAAVCVTTTGAFAAFVVGQHRVRGGATADEIDRTWPRTPGVAPAGAIVAFVPALAGVLSGEGVGAVAWLTGVAAFTFFGVYATVLVRGLESGDPVAIATLLLGAALLAVAVLQPGSGTAAAALAILAVITVLTVLLEQITRPGSRPWPTSCLTDGVARWRALAGVEQSLRSARLCSLPLSGRLYGHVCWGTGSGSRCLAAGAATRSACGFRRRVAAERAVSALPRLHKCRLR